MDTSNFNQFAKNIASFGHVDVHGDFHFHMNGGETAFTDHKKYLQVSQHEKHKIEFGPYHRKRYIEDNRKVQYLLDNYPDNSEFERTPKRFTITLLYFITVHYENENFLFLIPEPFTSNSVNSKTVHTGGLTFFPNLTVPAIVEDINPGENSARKVGEIRALYEQILQSENYLYRFEERYDAEKILFSNLGFESVSSSGRFDVDFSEGKTYLECRRTDRGLLTGSQGNVEYECNYVKEIFVKNVGCALMREFLNWDCRKPQFFLPLSMFSFENVEMFSPEDFDFNFPSIGTLYFKGMPIDGNVANVIVYEKQELIDNAMTIDSSDLSCNFKGGILFRIEIIVQNCDVIEQKFCEAVEQFFTLIGISHYRIERYQVTGSWPEEAKPFMKFIDVMYGIMTKIVDADLPMVCTVLVGDFTYGKISEIFSTRARFSGQTYENLCHMAHETYIIQESEKLNGILLGMTAQNEADSRKILSLEYGEPFTPKKAAEDDMLFRIRTF